MEPMFNKILTKVFGTKSDRDLKKSKPAVEEINRFYFEYHTLSDRDLRLKARKQPWSSRPRPVRRQLLARKPHGRDRR